ncbi:MAG: SGNH/GDSL hydrolase family protein [Legionella sp.]|jgi:hypothetical protein
MALPNTQITLIGDSTIDNRIWIDGFIKNLIYTKLGIGHTTPEQRINRYQHGLIKPELSVAENLRVQLPNTINIVDATNDGFTSADILNGAFRDKVFGYGTFSMFPHKYLSPFINHKEDIKNSDCIILSVGGNDVREFLQTSRAISANTREQYIKEQFPLVLERLRTNYLNIIDHIRSLNPNARIIIMTQYYPSAIQSNYKIYDFMKEVAKVVGINDAKPDPLSVIQHVVQQTLGAILTSLKDDANLVVADVTSSLNPLDKTNHTSQIEPSGKGGKKISQMLHHLISNDIQKGGIYRFTPEFFDNPSEEKAVIRSDISEPWQPLHPNKINEAEIAYKAAHPVESNWFFALKVLGVVTAASAVLALAWFALPVIAAIFTTAVVGVALGITAYNFFKPDLKKPVIDIEEMAHAALN